MTPEEAQTGGAMAPDEDAMPDPTGTGAVGAPSSDTPADARRRRHAATAPAARRASARAAEQRAAGGPGAGGATPAG